jgi:hypothetical protein
MLKLILPLTTQDANSDRKDSEPLALLVHPQQPLSYLERLIQAELPTLKTKDGKEKIPAVYFRAEDSMQDELEPSKAQSTPVEDSEVSEKENEEDFETADEIRIDGKTERTGKLNKKKKKDKMVEKEKETNARLNRTSTEDADKMRGGHGEGGVESYSGLGQDAPSDKQGSRKFVRWSSSTEIGDFIRDAARGQEFAVEIEGAPKDIRVGVPSFNDRTYYLRMRLRKTSTKISDMAEVKKECDRLAHKSAQTVAMAGFGILVSWWGAVYILTFETGYGWDVMEPVTVRLPLPPHSTPFPVPLLPFFLLLHVHTYAIPVPRRSLYPNRWLRVVSVPQPRSQLQIRHELHHLASAIETLRRAGL